MVGIPKLTVIVPAYNASSTIQRALRSVASQSLPPHEIIVADDGSLDETAEMAQREGARVIRTGGNLGPSAARNLACQQAEGELLAFLDADDFWYRDKLESQVKAMQADPDCALCYTSFIRFPSDGNPPTEESSFAQAVRVDLREVLRNPYLGTPTVLVRTAIFRELQGFNTEYRYGEDVDLWMRIAAKYPILHIPSVLCAVAVSPTSLTATGGDRVDLGNLTVLDAFERANPELALQFRAELRFIRASIHTRMASVQLRRRNRSAAWSDLAAALRASPTHKRAIYLFMRSIFPLP